MALSLNSKDNFRKGFIVVLLVILLIVFFMLINNLIVPLILSASFSSLLYPLRIQVERSIKGPRPIATVLVICLALIVIGVPFLVILTIAAKEAIQISETIIPWIKQQMDKPLDHWLVFLERLPFYSELKLYQVNLMEGFSKLLQTISAHFTQIVSAATSSTVEFFFKMFVVLYSAFFFLNDGERIAKTVTGYFPLTRHEINEMIDRMLLIIRATIKSIFIIGAVQGFLVTVAFWFLGIKTAVFWGILAAVLSAIPGLGAPLVWVPAVVYLVVSDQVGGAVILALWGVLVVGLADNLLRPMIVGKDSKVSELLIFLSVIGGLTVFGLAGLILGPVLMSLLLSVLHIYEKSFRRLLKEDREKR